MVKRYLDQKPQGYEKSDTAPATVAASNVEMNARKTPPSYETATGRASGAVARESQTPLVSNRQKEKQPIDGNQSPPRNLSPQSRDPAREIRIDEPTGSISGKYPLYDLLDVRTYSGSINIVVDPQPGHRKAVLRVHSMSGSTNIRFARPFQSRTSALGSEKSAYDRTYDIMIQGQSGSLSADLLHGGIGEGGKTVVHHGSGSLNLHVTPMKDLDASTLSTVSGSGSSNVTVHRPLWGKPLVNLSATHRSGSGVSNVHYPSDWEGKLHVWKTGGGTLNVGGDGLNYQQQSASEVLAWRGKDALKSGKTVEVIGEGGGSVQIAM